MSIRTVTLLSLYIGIIAILCVCSPKRFNKEVTIAVPFRVYSLPVYIAGEKSFFKRNDVNTTIIRTDTGHDAYERVSRGLSDLAIVPEGIAGRAVFDANVTVVGVLAVAQNEERIIYRTDRIKDVTKDLENKRIGLIHNSVSGEVFFDLFCDKYSVAKKKMVVTRGSYDEIERALKRGEIDAAVVIEPYGSMLIAQKSIPVESYTEKGLYKKYICVIANTKFAEKNAVSVVGCIKALINAEHVLYNDAHEATRICEVYFGASVFHTDRLFIDYSFFLHIPPDLETVLKKSAAHYYPEKHQSTNYRLSSAFFLPEFTHRVHLHRESIQ